MIQNIQDYTKMAPDGLSILKESVKRRFPADDTWVAWDDPQAFSWSSTIAEIIQEILQRHAEGIEFREYNVSSLAIAQLTPGWAQPRHGHERRGLQPEDLDRLGDRVHLRRQPLQLRHLDGQDGVVGEGGQQGPACHAARRCPDRDHRSPQVDTHLARWTEPQEAVPVQGG